MTFKKNETSDWAFKSAGVRPNFRPKVSRPGTTTSLLPTPRYAPLTHPPFLPQEAAQIEVADDGTMLVRWTIDPDSIVLDKPYSFTVKLKIGARVPLKSVEAVEMGIINTQLGGLVRFVVK